MSMRLYKVSGQWYTWDYLHNELGYTESASTTTAYKSSDSDTWGQAVIDSGYNIATDSTDLDTYQFWIENISGWFSASEIAQEGYYPSFATDGPRFVKEGELSVSVEISGIGWRDTWYLLKKDVAIGWCTISDLGEHGWEVDQGDIVGGLISATTDKPIYSFGNGGLEYPGGYAYSDGALLGMNWDFGGTVDEDVQGLPIVHTLNGAVGTLSQQGTQASVADGDSVYHYIYVDGAYQLSTISAGNTLGVVSISNDRAEDIQHGVGWIAERTSDGYVKITNNSGTTYVDLHGAWLAYCDSTNVTVVTVYKLSDGVAYNAFKFTMNGTDYYYVLDKTTDSTIDLILALRYSPPSGPFLSKTFPANDWWWSGIISQQEANNITVFGLNIVTQSDSSKWYCGPYGGLDYDPEYDYDLLELYSDMGETPITFDKSNFYLGANDYPDYSSYPDALLIHAISAFSTSTMTYKIRATKGGNRNQVMYLAQDRSVVNGSMSGWYPLYRRDGIAVEYTGSLPTAVIGFFQTTTTYELSTTDRGWSFRNNNGIIEVSASWGFTANRIVVKWTYILAYKQNGAVARCYKDNNLYSIPSASLNAKTEAQLNSLGWYVKWRKYSIISSDLGYLNIRPGYVTDNTPIATFEYGEIIWANPYLTGPSGYTSWFNIIISTDGGATTQSAWFDSSNAKLTYTESETDTNICLL